MKTIRIPKRTREQIKGLREDGETVSDTINRLLDDIEPSTCNMTGAINIALSDETYDKILSKKADGETLVKVIERAIYLHTS